MIKKGQNLIIAMDASISMSDSFGKGTKIQAVCDGIEMMIPQLSRQSGTQIGLVGYNEKPFVVSPLTWPNSHNLIKRAKRIHTGGCTNLLGGASLACDMLLRRPAHFSRRVIILTDGYHNTGSMTINQLILKAQANKIILDTIGIGNEGAYNKTLLVTLSSKTYGEFIPVKSLPKLLSTFRKLSSPKHFKSSSTKGKVVNFKLFHKF